jgi:hypothetical protein
MLTIFHNLDTGDGSSAILIPFGISYPPSLIKNHPALNLYIKECNPQITFMYITANSTMPGRSIEIQIHSLFCWPRNESNREIMLKVEIDRFPLCIGHAHNC